jgi:ATP-dependent helicase/nuclease subunit B
MTSTDGQISLFDRQEPPAIPPGNAVVRVFTGWDAPLLPGAAERLVDAHAGPESVRLDGVVVVVGGARGGRRLKELLVEAAERRGVPLVPPRVVTVGSLPELLYAPTLPPAEPVLGRRVWVAALRGLQPARLGAVFPHLPAPDDLRGWEALAAEVQRLREAVAAGGHDFAAVADVCGRGADLLHDDRARWDVLALAEERYLELLAGLGRVDPIAERRAALDGGRIAAGRDIWLVGVSEMPWLTQRMLLALDVPVRALVHAPEAESAAFDDLGCVRPEAWAEREIPMEDRHLRIEGRPSDQADAVVAELAALGSRFEVGDVVVAAPDAALVPYLERALEGSGVHARYAGGTPLARTAPIRLLQALAEYLGGAGWEAFAALLRHPDLPGWLARGGALPREEADRIAARADEYHARGLPADVRSVLPAHGTCARRVEEARAALDGLLKRLRGRKRLAAWAPEILGVLAEVYGQRQLRRDDPADQRLAAALRALRDAAASFHRLPAAADEACEAADALALLVSEVSSGTVPDEAEGAAVELLGWLELHLDDAPVALVAGLNEGALPESVNEDAFLPDRLRARLGLVDNARRYARDAYQVTALLHSREVVRFLGGRMDASGNPLRPSRLALALRGAPLARRVRRLVTASDDLPAPAAHAGGPSGFRLPPEPEIRFTPPESLPVTAFGLLLRDPYRWALERHLGLEPLDDGAREMDGRLFGTLAHAVLQDFGHAQVAAGTDAAEIRAWLDHRLDAEAAARFGRGAVPAVRLQVEQLRARLHAFAGWQAGHVGEGWEIAWVEGRPAGSAPGEETRSTAAAPFEVDGVPLTLTGRIDRIDHHRASGAWAVLDYKTGDTAESPEKTHRRGRAEKEWIDLQLPLYRHLAASVAGADGLPLIPAAALDRLALGYVWLPRDLQKVGAILAQWTPVDLAEADEAARRAVRTLRTGVVRFDEEVAGRSGTEPLAALLGLRQLVALADEEDENGE